MIYFSVLFLVCLINLYGIVLSLHIRDKMLRIFVVVLFGFCILRYTAVYIFTTAQSPLNLYILKNLVMTSIVSIPVLSYISIQILNKGIYKLFDKLFVTVLGVANLIIFYKAPIGIESAKQGYKVILDNNWQFLSFIIQGCFTAFMIYLSLNYLIKVKDIMIKTINALFFAGFAVAAAEEILIILNKVILPEPVISEGIILFSIISVLKIMQNNEIH